MFDRMLYIIKEYLSGHWARLYPLSLCLSFSMTWMIFNTITVTLTVSILHFIEFQSTSWWVPVHQRKIVIRRQVAGWPNHETEQKGNLNAEIFSPDPISAPPVPYSVQPGQEGRGRLLFITGPPGSGKSSSAQLLARDRGQFSGRDLLANCLCLKDQQIYHTVVHRNIAWRCSKCFRICVLWSGLFLVSKKSLHSPGCIRPNYGCGSSKWSCGRRKRRKKGGCWEIRSRAW